MELKYQITDIKSLNNDFVDFIYDNENLDYVQSHINELIYLWDTAEHILSNYFEDMKDFEDYMLKDNKNTKEIIYQIHENNFEQLNMFLKYLLNGGNETNVDSFDVLFFEFLDKLHLKKTLTINIDNYLLIGGKNKKVIKNLIDELKFDYKIIHTLNKRVKFRNYKLYILIKI